MSVLSTAPRPAVPRRSDPAPELLARDRWSRDDLLDVQRARLRGLLAHAVAESPHYRATLGRDAADRPLSALPVLTPRALARAWDRIVCDPRLGLTDAQRHLEGPRAAAPHLGRFALVPGPAVDGRPIPVPYDATASAIARAATLRALLRAGARASGRVAGIAAPGSAVLSESLIDVLQAARPGSPRLSVTTPFDELVAALGAYQPEDLVGPPGTIARLAVAQRTGRLALAPRTVAIGPVGLEAPAADDAQQAWGLEPAVLLAPAGLPVLASSTPEHPDALEIAEDLAIVEVVDAHDRPVPAGRPGAKVLVTTLTNRALPLVRLALPARVALAPGGNPAGRPYARLVRG